MSTRLADRLKAARRRHFVGRDAEKQLLQSALTSDDPLFYVMYVYGPGGVGKTTLLQEFGLMAQQAGVEAVYLDMRNVEPTPDAVLASVALALGATLPADPFELLQHRGRTLFLFDTCEMLLPLESWMRERFLPELPATTLTVMAGRNQLSTAWRADPGWQSLLVHVPLRNLAPDESMAYLDLRTVPEAERRRIVAFTHGHPLAISMVADVIDQQPGQHFEPIAAPDIIQSLLERLVQEAPSPLHQMALEAACLALYMTEALLAAMLDLPDVHIYFEWLRGLSFVEAGRYGLFPHDLVREAMVTDLRWRNPDLYVELHRRTRNFYHQRLRQTSGFNQRRLLAELIFLHRDNPVVRAFFEFQVNETLFTDQVRPSDAPVLVEMVRRHEGNAAAAIAGHWFVRQPTATLVIRDQRQAPVGFVTMLLLNEATSDDLARDPASRQVWEFVQRQGGLRAGEQALFFRFWMDGESYQAISTTQTRVFLNIIQYYLITPGLAFSFFPAADPALYQAVLAYADIHRAAQLDFETEGRPYGIFYHDWRSTPPMAWLELMAEREITYSAETALPPTPPPVSQAMLVLSEPEFAQAVRDALRHITRADELQGNPLVRSRLVVDRAGGEASPAARAAALHDVVVEVIDLLKSSPRQMKLYRALYHTYLQPAATQELAAEVLDLPFSTYRRHLKEGIDNVVETLWGRELGS